ncbi:MFS transporter [Cryobacterium sp. Y57]|uniref:MFS transporter n=1 Tax=Cryobacterium sp. Y57 TaxID=2048287 RepID=UPI001304C75F|nr:MFS transporter [Cryobacterium sp. Y57]
MDKTQRNLWSGGFRQLFAAQSISAIGDRLSFVVLPFLILGHGGDAVAVVLVLGARAVGFSASVLAGGVVADRIGPRITLVLSDLLRAVVQGLVVALFISSDSFVTALAALMVVYGVVEGVAIPSSRALLPRVVPDAVLERANGYMSAAYTSGHLVGPLLAGIFVALDLSVLAIGIDAASFVVSAILIWTTRPRSLPEESSGTVLSQFVEGFKTLLARRWLLWMIAAGVVLHLTTLPAVYALGPVWAETNLGGGAGWGILMSAFGVGGVLGGLVATRLRPQRPAIWYFVGLIVVAAQPINLVSGAPFWLVAGLQSVAGFALAVLGVMEDLSAQRGIPGALLARVGSFAVFASTVATPVGYALVGGVSAWAGVAPTMYVMGAICVIIVAFGVLLPSVRKFAPKPSGAALQHKPTVVDVEKSPT